jgi:hypothetical protein
MTHEEHIEEHKKLHEALDELLADYFTHAKGSTKDTILNLMAWSYAETINPTEE